MKKNLKNLLGLVAILSLFVSSPVMADPDHGGGGWGGGHGGYGGGGGGYSGGTAADAVAPSGPAPADIAAPHNMPEDIPTPGRAITADRPLQPSPLRAGITATGTIIGTILGTTARSAGGIGVGFGVGVASGTPRGTGAIIPTTTRTIPR